MKGSSCNRPALVLLCMDGREAEFQGLCTAHSPWSLVLWKLPAWLWLLKGDGACAAGNQLLHVGEGAQKLWELFQPRAQVVAIQQLIWKTESLIPKSSTQTGHWKQVMPLCTHETDVLLLKCTSDMFQFQKVNFFPSHSFTSI